MRRRPFLALPLAITATLLLAGVAAAGGWATATLDPPPDDPTVGEPVEIGFTLMQHGVTPTSDGPAELHLINSETGGRTSFAATPSGGDGHWTARVTFPAAGTYRFEITHDLEIEPVNLDAISVTVAEAPATTPAASGSSAALAILAGAVGLLLAVALWVLGGRRSATAATFKRA